MEPIDRKQIAEYYDAFLPHLQQDHVRDNQRLSRVKVKLGSLVKPGMTILDLGCGTGITSRFMATLGAKVTAVDISPKLIEFARKESNHKNVEYIISDITELALQNERGQYWQTFDGIVLVDVFEHVLPDKLFDLFQTINDHSKPEAWVFVNIPDGRYQEAAHKYIPQKLQIVDEGYPPQLILSWFYRNSWGPVDIDIYGVDVECQYNTFLFKKIEAIEKIHKEFMRGIE